MQTVVLIGDSIRKGYEQTVRDELAGAAAVFAPEANGGDSHNVLAHLQEWAGVPAPAVVHVNCGLHDIKTPFDENMAVVPLDAYEQNVRTILAQLRDTRPDAKLIWALTTPVNHAWHHEKKDFDRFEKDVTAYNNAARRAASDLGVTVNDLYSVVAEAGRDRLLVGDGVHFTPEGYALLGRHVAGAIRPFLPEA